MRIHIMPKTGTLDPQGKAIARALNDLGFSGLQDARQGKIIELTLEDHDPTHLREVVDSMCQRLLANPVIEDYQIVFDPS